MPCQPQDYDLNNMTLVNVISDLWVDLCEISVSTEQKKYISLTEK